MNTALVITVVTAAVLNGFSGLVSLTLWPPMIRRQLEPTMEAVGVPRSWLRFPIGFCKVLGAAGLVTGLICGLPALTALTAVGLFGYWSCAIFSHLRVAHYDHHLITTSAMLLLSVAMVLLQLAVG